MIVLAGGDIVLPDRVLQSGSLILDGNRITAVEPRPSVDPAGARIIDVSRHWVVPGFIDVHVHGVEGIDTLDGRGAITALAQRLPRYGVTAFCPTTVACSPAMLRTVLGEVAQLESGRPAGAARVLPAHLESNFINPDYKGAQPAACLRHPTFAVTDNVGDGDFSAADVLAVIAASRAAVGIVTLAPELPGGIDLIRQLVTAGHRVSLGHSGADFDTAVAAIEAGARHATHLFNRMAALSHRAPGLIGAVLASNDVVAELICDGYHVHPAVGQMAIAAKGVDRMMAITDGTAGSGLAIGATARLGGQTIHIRESAATLADGTLAGSTLTMNRAFEHLVRSFHQPLVAAAALCATTPARELGLRDLGVITPGAIADIAVLDQSGAVEYTFIDGELAFTAAASQRTASDPRRPPR